MVAPLASGPAPHSRRGVGVCDSAVVHDNHRIVGRAVVVATAVTVDGNREVAIVDGQAMSVIGEVEASDDLLASCLHQASG